MARKTNNGTMSTGIAIQNGLNVIPTTDEEMIANEIMLKMIECGYSFATDGTDSESAETHALLDKLVLSHKRNLPVYIKIIPGSDIAKKYPTATEWDFDNNQPVQPCVVRKDTANKSTKEKGTMKKANKAKAAAEETKATVNEAIAASKDLKAEELAMKAAAARDSLKSSLAKVLASQMPVGNSGIEKTKSWYSMKINAVLDCMTDEEILEGRYAEEYSEMVEDHIKNLDVKAEYGKVIALEKEMKAAASPAKTVKDVTKQIMKPAEVKSIDDAEAAIKAAAASMGIAVPDKPKSAPRTESKKVAPITNKSGGKVKLRNDVVASQNKNNFWYREFEGVDVSAGILDTYEGSGNLKYAITFEEPQFCVSKIYVYAPRFSNDRAVCDLSVTLSNGINLTGFKVWNSKYEDGSLVLLDPQYSYKKKDKDEKDVTVYATHVATRDRDGKITAPGYQAVLLSVIDTLIEPEVEVVAENNEDEE